MRRGEGTPPYEKGAAELGLAGPALHGALR